MKAYNSLKGALLLPTTPNPVRSQAFVVLGRLDEFFDHTGILNECSDATMQNFGNKLTIHRQFRFWSNVI